MKQNIFMRSGLTPVFVYHSALRGGKSQRDPRMVSSTSLLVMLLVQNSMQLGRP